MKITDFNNSESSSAYDYYVTELSLQLKERVKSLLVIYFCDLSQIIGSSHHERIYTISLNIVLMSLMSNVFNCVILANKSIQPTCWLYYLS